MTETVHSWLKKIRVAYVPGPTTPLLDDFAAELLRCFSMQGHTVMDRPETGVDVLLATASFGQPLNWREAPLFVARKQYQLDRTPLVFTLLHASPQSFQDMLDHFQRALAKSKPDPDDFSFPGMAPQAFHTLYEQGTRGGPLLSLIRMVQSQAKSIRIVLVLGEDHPLEAYTFDLVGAHPRTPALHPETFYTDLVLRIVTAASTQEITEHQFVGEPVSPAVWQSLATPKAMQAAGIELGKRNFFTEMVRVANLVSVPAVHETVSRQYSEGCFATWDPVLQALVTTITGSARPVDKGKLGDDDLAVITGVRPDGRGALVRMVAGKRNDPPSSESVEMMEMDRFLPRVRLGERWGLPSGDELQVPVARSKLHGHRGVRSFDPRWVEHVSLDPPYYHYPVSCSTEAQAWAVRAAFSRSEALTNPSDPRPVAFTLLPGHGVVIVEKWVPGKEPFQLIWEYIDAGTLEIEPVVPQGTFKFVPDGTGRLARVDEGK